MIPHSSVGMRLPGRDLNTLDADWVDQWICETRSPLRVCPEPLNHWTVVFFFSVLKKYYKNTALRDW